MKVAGAFFCGAFLGAMVLYLVVQPRLLPFTPYPHSNLEDMHVYFVGWDANSKFRTSCSGTQDFSIVTFDSKERANDFFRRVPFSFGGPEDQ